MGRPRLAIASSADAELRGAATSSALRRALETPSAKRKPDQVELLLKWYRSKDAEWQALNKKVQDHLQQKPKPNTVKALVSSEGLPPVRLHPPRRFRRLPVLRSGARPNLPELSIGP